MAIALDGTPISNISTGGGQTSVVLTGVTNTIASDIILVFASSNVAITGCSGSTRGAYTTLVNLFSTASTAIFYFMSSNAITENITVTCGSASFVQAMVTCISGVNLVTPWDPLATPNFVTNTTFHTAGPTVTTTGSSSVTEWIIGAKCDPGAGSPAVDTSWTSFTTPVMTNLSAEYFPVIGGTAQQVNSSLRFTYAMIGAALQPAAPSGDILMPAICM
jgi:hypothetical protein